MENLILYLLYTNLLMGNLFAIFLVSPWLLLTVAILALIVYICRLCIQIARLLEEADEANIWE